MCHPYSTDSMEHFPLHENKTYDPCRTDDADMGVKCTCMQNEYGREWDGTDPRLCGNLGCVNRLTWCGVGWKKEGGPIYIVSSTPSVGNN